MKPVKICRSLGLLLVLTFSLVVLLSSASACAEDPTAPRSGAAAGVSGSNVASKWVGVYDGSGRGCRMAPLTIRGSTFTWGDCNTVKIRVIGASDTEFAFEVDPSAKCGWAGWIVALTPLSPDWRVVDVNAYRRLEKYQAKQYDLFCGYSKRTPR